MALLYSIVIHFVYLLALPVTLFSRKVRLWVNGRKNWYGKLKQWQHSTGPTLWFHAASLGEFEQGLPLMEECKRRLPDCNLILTFYSPSGYEIRKNYTKAGHICYLPLDTRYNARKFIQTVKPDAAFFIKYEFWYFYLNELHRTGVPVYLISGIFRPQQIYFQWYGKWFRKKLSFFTHFFLQDSDSADLIRTLCHRPVTVAGDTRLDRVAATALNAKNIAVAEAFSESGLCIVAGSTWPADEELLSGFINESAPNLKFIIAPHEIDTVHIKKLEAMITRNSILYSEATLDKIIGVQVLIIDNIGLLSSLYRYGQFAYIGGGFGKGIHNILEAAVFGMPVVFGPNHEKFREALEIAETGGGFPIKTAGDLHATFNRLIEDEELRLKASAQAKAYVMNNTGATRRIMHQVLEDSNSWHSPPVIYKTGF